MRVLDIDLDFFVHDPAYFKSSRSERLNAEEHRPWPLEEAIAFIAHRCGVTARTPGCVVEHHAELFPQWRSAIEAGFLEPPLSITHVDAHADLGLGDPGYVYLLTELLFQPIEKRHDPATGVGGLDDGNWLCFAIACGWVSDLTYVYTADVERPIDLMPCIMKGFDADSGAIQLAGIPPEELAALFSSREPAVAFLEPEVPFAWVHCSDYQAAHAFDVICLTRSPGFTPPEADALFEEIRERFIDEAFFNDASAGGAPA